MKHVQRSFTNHKIKCNPRFCVKLPSASVSVAVLGRIFYLKSMTLVIVVKECSELPHLRCLCELRVCEKSCRFKPINIVGSDSANEACPQLSDRLSTGRQKLFDGSRCWEKIVRGCGGSGDRCGVHRPSPSRRVARTSSAAVP